jgi:hypothetical protein
MLAPVSVRVRIACALFVLLAHAASSSAAVSFTQPVNGATIATLPTVISGTHSGASAVFITLEQDPVPPGFPPPDGTGGARTSISAQVLAATWQTAPLFLLNGTYRLTVSSNAPGDLPVSITITVNVPSNSGFLNPGFLTCLTDVDPNVDIPRGVQAKVINWNGGAGFAPAVNFNFSRSSSATDPELFAGPTSYPTGTPFVCAQDTGGRIPRVVIFGGDPLIDAASGFSGWSFNPATNGLTARAKTVSGTLPSPPPSGTDISSMLAGLFVLYDDDPLAPGMLPQFTGTWMAANASFSFQPVYSNGKITALTLTLNGPKDKTAFFKAFFPDAVINALFNSTPCNAIPLTVNPAAGLLGTQKNAIPTLGCELSVDVKFQSPVTITIPISAQKPAPTITTQQSAVGNLPGTLSTDTAVVSGSGPVPAGSVAFFLCGPGIAAVDPFAGCLSGGTPIGGPVALDGGGQATSGSTLAAQTMNPGLYCWRAEYSGDANYLGASHTNSTTECFTIAASPAITAPPDGFVTTDVLVTIQGVAPGLGPITLYDNGNVLKTFNVVTSDKTFSEPFVLGYGTHELTVTQTAFGTTTTGNAVTGTVVLQTPVITAPVDGFVTTDVLVTIQGYLPPGTASQLTLFDNGNALKTFNVTTSDDTFSQAFVLGYGTHVLTASLSALGTTGPLSNTVTGTVLSLVPIFTGVSPNLQAEGAGAAGTMLTYALPTAVSTTGGSLPVNCTPASGSTFPLGGTTVTCTATDAYGNSASSSFTVTVVDTRRPAFALPGMTLPDHEYRFDPPAPIQPGVVVVDVTANSVWDSGFGASLFAGLMHGAVGRTTRAVCSANDPFVGRASALIFNGASESYVDFGSLLESVGTSDLALSLWIRLPALAGTAPPATTVLLSNRSATSTNGLELSVQPLGPVRFALNDVAAEGGFIPLDGTWHFIVAQRSGADLSLFVDGIPAGSTRGPDPTPLNVANGSPLLMGGPGGSLVAIDPFRVYTTVLSDDEIQRAFATGGGDGTCGATEGLLNVVASSSDGAVVVFGPDAGPDPTPIRPPFAFDAVDPSPVVECKAGGNVVRSGDVFPIGDTVVTCTASDMSANMTAGSFLVHAVLPTTDLIGYFNQVSAYHDPNEAFPRLLTDGLIVNIGFLPVSFDVRYALQAEGGGAPIVLAVEKVSLKASEAVATSASLLLKPPYPPTGNYRLVMTLDVNNEVAETDEANVVTSNLFEIGPDPAGSVNLGAEAYQMEGEQVAHVYFTGVLFNAGPIPASFDVQYALQPFKGGPPIVLRVDHVSLTGGGAIDMPNTLPIAPPYPPSDKYRLVVTVDPANQVLELHEDNNVTSTDWFSLGVDLSGAVQPNTHAHQATDAAFPEVLLEGWIADTAQLPASFAAQYALEPYAGGSPIVLAVLTQSLAATKLVDMPTALPIKAPVQSGVYRLAVTLDPANEVSELDESNNVIVSNWFDVGVNATISLSSVNPVPNAPILVVEGLIGNDGEVKASFDVQYALKPFGGGATIVVSTQKVTLNAKEFSAIGGVPVSPPPPPGFYQLVVTVDPANQIAELHENDNVATSDLFVLDWPSISAVNPLHGPAGTKVTITGAGFTNTTGVAFSGGSAPALFVVVGATKITATVPANATAGPITVTTAGGTATSADSFNVTQPPTIADFNPKSGLVGSHVTITGSGFTGTTSVKFKATTAIFTLIDDTTIDATVPPTTLDGKITVTTAGGAGSSASVFNVITPTVGNFSPKKGSAGTLISISGSDLASTTAVSFDGHAAASLTVVSNTLVTAVVPAGATTGKLTLTTAAGPVVSSGDFTVVPKIDDFTPKSGLAGSHVTISGSGFTGTTSVKFKNTTSIFTVVDDGTIDAIVPPTTLDGKITVTTAGGIDVSASAFTVTKPPPIVP